MTWIYAFISVLAVVAGVRYYRRISAARSSWRGGPPRVDDAAIRGILAEGRISAPEQDDPLDPDEIARAEQEFWDEPWDEPEE